MINRIPCSLRSISPQRLLKGQVTPPSVATHSHITCSVAAVHHWCAGSNHNLICVFPYFMFWWWHRGMPHVAAFGSRETSRSDRRDVSRGFRTASTAEDSTAPLVHLKRLKLTIHDDWDVPPCHPHSGQLNVTTSPRAVTFGLPGEVTIRETKRGVHNSTSCLWRSGSANSS